MNFRTLSGLRRRSPYSVCECHGWVCANCHSPHAKLYPLKAGELFHCVFSLVLMVVLWRPWAFIFRSVLTQLAPTLVIKREFHPPTPNLSWLFNRKSVFPAYHSPHLFSFLHLNCIHPSYLSRERPSVMTWRGRFCEGSDLIFLLTLLEEGVKFVFFKFAE